MKCSLQQDKISPDFVFHNNASGVMTSATVASSRLRPPEGTRTFLLSKMAALVQTLRR